jgi:ABC-type phosphate transport system substrate-binding protein
MRSRCHDTRVRRCLAALLAIGALVVSRAAEAEPESLVVVANDTGPLLAASDAELRDMFLGKIRVVGGVAIQPAQLEGPARATFAHVLLGMSESEFQLYWMRKSYEDGRLPPPMRSSSEDMLRFVASRPGAIGFVEKRMVHAGSGVRVLREIAVEGGG